MWASENEGHLQAPYESAFEFCVLTYYLFDSSNAKKRRKKEENYYKQKEVTCKNQAEMPMRNN